jgi:3-hydroxyacyl-[acyl-carrier-protein] dehydratase
MTLLYNISNLTAIGNSFSAEITFNPAHPVFAGHFPGQPIVPGVVLVDISAAVLSLVTGKSLIVSEASVIKFLKVIDPGINLALLIDGSIVEEDKGYKANLTISSGETIFMKIKGMKLIHEEGVSKVISVELLPDDSSCSND